MLFQKVFQNFHVYHWQCYVSKRNGALFVAIGKLMEIGIGGFLLPRTKVLRKWKIHLKQFLRHLFLLQISAPSPLATMWKTATAGFSKFLKKSRPRVAVYSADRSPDQTTPRRTTSWRIWSEGAQTRVRWARCCIPSSSPSYRCL